MASYQLAYAPLLAVPSVWHFLDFTNTFSKHLLNIFKLSMPM